MLNQCNFIGNLGADPETRALQNGDAVTNFSVACTERWKDKQTGEQKEQTEWVRAVAFRKLGEICGQYLTKGSKVFISGKMRTRKWEDNEGNTKYSTEVVVSEMKMLGGDPKQDPRKPAADRPQQEQARRPEPEPEFGDDIPF